MSIWVLRTEQEMDRWIVMRMLLWSVVVKKDLNQKAKLQMYWSVYITTLTYSRKIYVMILEKKIQEVKPQ